MESTQCSTKLHDETTTPTIPEWFKNRSIFVTGGTGFMGKVLLSKLLMSCPDIDKIYFLVREKKGVSPKGRLSSIIEQEPFRKIRENYAERLNKLVIIEGDVTLDNFNLSDKNKDLLTREVSVVFHNAANVKFDVSLKEAVKGNTKGTANIIDLCKQMKNLKALIHVSTAYTHCDQNVLNECPYPSPWAPEKVLNLVDILDEELLSTITPQLLKHSPNTYAFSKALSEDLINRSNLPVGVARPSIVVAAWKEPTPGWIESLNGPTGMIIGCSKGIIRSALCDSSGIADMVPCDITINAIIALAWKVGIESPTAPMYMNITGSGENPLSWGDAVELTRKHTWNYPLTGLLWYPRGGPTTNKLYHKLNVLLFQMIPAYFIDALCVLSGNKPFLLRVQKKVDWGMRLLQYYLMKQWDFRNERLQEMRENLLPADKDVFYMNLKGLEWNQFLLDYYLGARKFVMRENPDTLPAARIYMKIYWLADVFCKILFFGLFLWYIYSKFTFSTM